MFDPDGCARRESIIHSRRGSPRSEVWMSEHSIGKAVGVLTKPQRVIRGSIGKSVRGKRRSDLKTGEWNQLAFTLQDVKAGLGGAAHFAHAASCGQ
jgi:hypothetical protein